ncbi:MAG: SAM-dependent methyltransferase, partial [Burkholderiales bacterium]
LYDLLDASGGFYAGHAGTACRSDMNVTFRLPDEALEKEFVKGATARGLMDLKGHRSVGGIRASIYNAMPVAGVEFLEGDFREDTVLAQLDAMMGRAPSLDLVLSDLAPNLTGIGSADAARMGHLAELALAFAVHHLKPDGALLIKCFHGSGYSQVVETFKRAFVTVAPRKPKASRDKSAETYLLGRSLKPGVRTALPTAGS